MLQEKSNEEASPSAEGAGDKDAETSSRCKEYELIHISPSELHERYKRVLIQAYMLDEAGGPRVAPKIMFVDGCKPEQPATFSIQVTYDCCLAMHIRSKSLFLHTSPDSLGVENVFWLLRESVEISERFVVCAFARP